jgi:TPR repeat protein
MFYPMTLKQILSSYEISINRNSLINRFFVSPDWNSRNTERKFANTYKRIARVAVTLALIAGFAIAPTAWADYLSGKDAYARKDYATAFREFRPLAEQGHIKAQTYLGIMYYFGSGVEQDFAKAAKWYRAAAEQGFARAQNNLGVFYEQGHGGAQDFTKSTDWYRAAAEQGFAPGQHNLGISYMIGRGVPQDLVRAYMWFTVAAEQIQESRSALSDLDKRLSHAQRTRGKALTLAWRQAN